MSTIYNFRLKFGFKKIGKFIFHFELVSHFGGNFPQNEGIKYKKATRQIVEWLSKPNNDDEKTYSKCRLSRIACLTKVPVEKAPAANTDMVARRVQIISHSAPPS